MKSFVKMTLAVLAGLFLWGVICLFFLLTFIGSLSAIGTSSGTASIPKEGVLDINFSNLAITEQTCENNPASLIQGLSTVNLGIWDAVRAINTAAEDPAIKFIYLRPDNVTGGIAEIEELRKALENAKTAGKPIIAYTENPSNGSYYLASVADKIYMTSCPGGMSTVLGFSSQLFFLKDILDKMGVNVQFIRHGKYKSAGEMYSRSDISEENRQQNTQLISSIWNSWAEQIAQSRGLHTEQFNSIVDNLELNYPQDFLDRNLVDKLMTKQQMRDMLCNLYGEDDPDDIKAISLGDYAAAKLVSDFRKKNKVAILYADGNIVDGDDPEDVAGDKFVREIYKIRKDSTIKAVVFRVNSPGGSVAASERIRQEISLLGEVKPVIASYGAYAASGGYWISAGCDHIFCDRTTITGSIGVFSMIPDFGNAAKKLLSVNVVSINSNKHSDMLSGMRPLDRDELDYMQASVEDIYERFTAIVARGRDMTVNQVDGIAQGRVWSGADAVEIGLVDEIGTLEDAVRYACTAAGGCYDDFATENFPKPQTTMEKLMTMLSENSSARIFGGTALESVEKAFADAAKWTAPHHQARLPYVMEIK